MIQVTNLSKMFPVVSVYRYRGRLRMITGLSFGGENAPSKTMDLKTFVSESCRLIFLAVMCMSQSQFFHKAFSGSDFSQNCMQSLEAPTCFL